MSLIKKNELRQMNEQTLKEKLIELKKELLKIEAKRATHAVPEKPKRRMVVRKTIARIKTIIWQKKHVQPINEKSTGGKLKAK